MKGYNWEKRPKKVVRILGRWVEKIIWRFLKNLDKRDLKKVVRNFRRWIETGKFFLLVDVRFKNLVGPGHPRPSARHCLSIYEKRLTIIYLYCSVETEIFGVSRIPLLIIFISESIVKLDGAMAGSAPWIRHWILLEVKFLNKKALLLLVLY